MGKTITLSDPRIESLSIDITNRVVHLNWRIDLPNGKLYASGEFVFYDNEPVDKIVDYDPSTGDPIYGIPDNWAALNSTAKAALTTLINLGQTFLSNQDL